MNKSIAIIDLGGQYCHLIHRRFRELGVESDIFSPETTATQFNDYAGIVLSGGPNSVYESGSPQIDPMILSLKKPILGICYGHQLLAKMLGAIVAKGSGEYGPAKLQLLTANSIFVGTPKEQTVWISHTD